MEIWNAGGDFIRQWFPILRRPALHDVGDVHRFSGNFNSLENAVEQLPRLADEGTAGRVLPGTWSFPYQDQSGLGIALARDRVDATGTERAAIGSADPLRYLFQRGQIPEVVAQESRFGRLHHQARTRDWRRSFLPLRVRHRGSLRRIRYSLPQRRRGPQNDLGPAELDLLRQIAAPLIAQWRSPPRREWPRPLPAWIAAAR